MTSRKTSESGYYVRGLASRLRGNAALDTGAVRLGVINNLNHLQDEMGQAGSTLCLPSSPAIGNGYYTQAVTTVGTYTRMDSMPPSPTFLRMQSDGSSSRVQVTILGYISAAGTARFRASLQPMSLGSRAVGFTPASPGAPATTVTSADASTTSTTPTALRFTLYCPRLSTTTSHDGRSWLQSFPSKDGNGVLTTVSFYAGVVEIWASADSASTHPRITSISVREYVG